MSNDALKEFAKMMAEELKKTKEKSIAPSLNEQSQNHVEKTNTAIEVSKYLSRPKIMKEDIKSEHDKLVNISNDSNNIPAAPSNIEAQRWNDPLRKEPNEKFVTFKEMNDHYGLFLQRIQQQMATIGGGGEVNLRGLDDVITSSTGTNKFLTYNPSTRKFYFDTVNVSDGLQVQSGILSTKTTSSFGYEVDGTLKLNPASTTEIGGIKLGPGVELNGLNQLVIDSEGLDFSFGDFFAYTDIGPNGNTAAYLSSINDNEDIVIASNGTGQVDIIGRFSIFTTAAANNITSATPVFNVNDDGDITATTLDITNSSDLGLVAPLNVSINEAGLTKTPAVVSGVVAQFTGRDENYATLVVDAYGVDPNRGEGGGLVFRTGLGTNQNTTAITANSVLGRIETTGWASNGYGGVATTSLRFVANEDFTATNRGGRMEFWNVPNGSILAEKIATVDETGITINTAEGGINNTSFITFDTTHLDDHTTEGTLCWNAPDGTLNLHHADGVVQQIGQEMYAYVINDTGSEIPNGTCVRFDGAVLPDGEARLAIAPFQANGVYPNLYGLGIATQTLSDDEEGRVCVWGKVRDINTTGQGGETWIVGDILYASPASAGGLTKVKPTAPNNVVPVAAVLRVDATEGELFVRPTISQRQDYGVFTRTTDYQPADPNTAYAITVDTTEISSGTTLGTPASRFVAGQSGLYQIDWVVRWATVGNASDEDIWYTWLRKNGTDVPNSMRSGGIDGESQFVSSSSSRIVTLNTGDYLEIAIAVSNVNVRLDAAGDIAFGPSAAALEVNVVQIQL